MKQALTPFQGSVAFKQLSFRSRPGYPACSTHRTPADKTLGFWKASRKIDHPDYLKSTDCWQLGAVGLLQVNFFSIVFDALQKNALVREDADKVFHSVRAALAVHGHALHRTYPNDGAGAYWAERWGLVRYLPTINTALLFLEQTGGRL